MKFVAGTPLTLSEIASSTLFHRPDGGGSTRPTYPLSTLSNDDNDGDGDGTMPFVSRAEHPVTGLLTWFVHPCETQTIVDEIVLGQDGSAGPEQWVATWLMVVGSVVDLRD